MDGLARRARLARSRLYFVTERVPEDILDATLRGGVDIVQLREKELPDDDLVAAAEPFRRACERHGALFVLNDRPELVERCGADGVHVGQGDAAVDEARRLVGDDRIVGLSVSTREQMTDVGSADYLGVGTIFATPKTDEPANGLLLVRDARYGTQLPWFAIGGIDRSNVAELVANGAAGVAVVRAIRDADDPEAAARALRAALPPTDAVVTDGHVCIPQVDWLRGTNAKAAPHVHLEHADLFYLLDGTLEFRAGEGTVRLPAGSCLAAPPLLVHGFRNPDESTDAHYLNLHVPGGWARAPKGTSDTEGVDRANAQVRPIVSAPGDGDRLTAPHRLAVVKVDLPQAAVVENFADDEFEGPELHVHLRHADCFHVLEGTLEFTLEGGPVRVEPGTSVVVPPGVPHTFTTASPRTRWLNVHAPSMGFVDYLRDPSTPFDQYAV